jgi:hypothetical protein
MIRTICTFTYFLSGAILLPTIQISFASVILGIDTKTHT